MLKTLMSAFRKVAAHQWMLPPEGQRQLQKLGHRTYVGGMWEEIGLLQFEFLKRQGLTPSDCLLDIACGSLRGGVHFVNFLDVGNYLGIDKENALIELGIENELGRGVYDYKTPEFVVSDRFEFEKFSKRPRFSIAQSLFTHLIPRDICLCFGKLRAFVEPNHVFFATFLEGSSSANLNSSHSLVGFQYSPEEMATFGSMCGWKATYIGNWNHPKKQMMMRYEPG